MNEGAITLRFRGEARHIRPGLSAWWQSAMPPAPIGRRIVFWALVWIGLLAVTVGLGAYGIGPAFVGAGLVGAAFLIAVFGVLQRTRMRTFAEVIARHWERAGDTVAEFDPGGLRLRDDLSERRFDWAAIDAVAKGRGVTVLRTGVSMVAIPDTALPDGLSPKDFRDRLRQWRAAG